jgi:hypothetical protein
LPIIASIASHCFSVAILFTSSARLSIADHCWHRLTLLCFSVAMLSDHLLAFPTHSLSILFCAIPLQLHVSPRFSDAARFVFCRRYSITCLCLSLAGHFTDFPYSAVP